MPYTTRLIRIIAKTRETVERTHSFLQCNKTLLRSLLYLIGGRDSSVGIATRYGLDGPGIEYRWGARFSALGPTQPPVQWVPGLSWGLSGRGLELTTHLHVSAEVMKG